MSLILSDLLHQVFEKQTLLLAVLSHPKMKGDEHPHKISIKPVTVKKKLFYQAETYIQTKVFHKNFSTDESLTYFSKQFPHNFQQASLFTMENDIQLLVNKKGKLTILKKPPTKVVTSTAHNRKKNYLLEEGNPLPFLVELGICNSSGKILDKKRDKFRQINRFLELFQDLFSQLKPRQKWHIVDFGCGKAYLTFALYHFLTQEKGMEVDLVGLDLKADVIAFCQALATKLNYSHLQFQVGDIGNHKPKEKVDIMLSLHACDTATDAALEKAVRWQADAILCVPCCQHELYSQIDHSFLEPLLKHGILKERFAALATDAARGHLLEILGYKTQILEFVDLENTPKNLMIRAIREETPRDKTTLKQRYLEYKKALHIFPSLEKRFASLF